MLAYLHPVRGTPECVENYRQYEDELNMKGIQYPMILSQMEKFEKQNVNMSVDVFTFESNTILPLQITSASQRLHHINLLLIKRGGISHYCLITNQPLCSSHGAQKVELPSPGDRILKFKEYDKMLEVPFVIYSDMETVNRGIDTCVTNFEYGNTTRTAQLDVCGFG